MPIYANLKVGQPGECSDDNSLDCAKSFKLDQYAPDDEEIFSRPEIRPEETADYIEAKARYEAHIKMMEETLTVFDDLYWKRLYFKMMKVAVRWGECLSKKAFVLGKELAGCLITGGVLMGAMYGLLAILGPIKIKTLGILILVFMVGSIFATESIEMAASALIGMSLILLVFLAKMSTGNRVLKVKNRNHKNKLNEDLNEDYIYVFIDFWYAGNRTVWFNLSEKIVGIL